MKIIRTKFNKEGDMIYISHLDLQQLLQRAFRRAEIDLVHSQGFNPHPRRGPKCRRISKQNERTITTRYKIYRS